MNSKLQKFKFSNKLLSLVKILYPNGSRISAKINFSNKDILTVLKTNFKVSFKILY